MALAEEPLKTYPIHMTKKLLSWAAFMKRELTPLPEDAIPVRVQESVVYLNAEEAAYVDMQTRQFLKEQLKETQRKRKLGIPPPPTPGSISYAVYY